MFSIVIPVFNSRRTLGRAVESVLAQSFEDFELILVDDGSTDDGLATVVGIKDRRLRVLRQENAGPGPARNAGANAARNETIAFLDSDDLWLPDHLAELDRLRREFPQAGLFGTAYSYSGSRDSFPRVPRDGGRRGLIDYFDAVGRGETVLCASSAAVSRTAWLDGGGFKPFPSGEDSELWVRLAMRRPVAASTRVTAIYLRRDEGITQTRRRLRIGRPPASLDDLSPAVATLRRHSTAVPPRQKRSIERFVARYFHWHLREAVEAFDLATIRGLARMTPSGVALADRLILRAARFPDPVARILCALLARASP